MVLPVVKQCDSFPPLIRMLPSFLAFGPTVLTPTQVWESSWKFNGHQSLLFD
jgi:hypothetical protein